MTVRRSWLVASLASLALVGLGRLQAQDPPPPHRAPAPDFTLEALDGQRVTLSELKGSLVVLEWFDPACPQVIAHHQGPLNVAHLAGRYTSRVRWFAVASGQAATDKERLIQAVRELGISYPVLLDPSGQVARAFGASVTPETFLIDDQGQLRYQGAVYEQPTSDVRPIPRSLPGDGAGPDPAPPQGPVTPDPTPPDPDDVPEGAPLREPGQTPPARPEAEPAPRCPLEQAILAVLAGQPVERPRTQAWGCPLKLAPQPEPRPPGSK